MRNPTWNREELILALDLYFKLEYGQMHGRNSDVIELSHILTLMNASKGIERSVNSIPLKLANFKRFDPVYEGTGMKSGAKLDESIWEEFVNDKNGLVKKAKKIKMGILNDSISGRRTLFIEWLGKVGKTDGSNYKQSTINTYAAQVEKSILNEFSLDVEYNMGLYLITDLQTLGKIDEKLNVGEDNKKRRDLRSAFQSYVRFVRDEFEFNDQVQLPDEFQSKTEGGKKVYISQRAERDSGLRNKAIAIHGTACKACGFDFGEQYGEWGEGYIEVHHLIQLGGSASKERKTDPLTDLTVLCANCHRMVHRKRKMVLSLAELQQKMKTPIEK
ncbi:MAG: putative HNH restriction endonuclease [Crocinitomicaceae bacterium]|jgi:predicted HNH restriction endonuclease